MGKAELATSTAPSQQSMEGRPTPKTPALVQPPVGPCRTAGPNHARLPTSKQLTDLLSGNLVQRTGLGGATVGDELEQILDAAVAVIGEDCQGREGWVAGAFCR